MISFGWILLEVGHLSLDNGKSSLYIYIYIYHNTRGCPRGIIVKEIDCGLVISEFELQSRYYVHFRANTLGKGMNPLIPPAMGQILSLLFFKKDDFGIKLPTEVDMP